MFYNVSVSTSHIFRAPYISAVVGGIVVNWKQLCFFLFLTLLEVGEGRGIGNQLSRGRKLFPLKVEKGLESFLSQNYFLN